jgi:SAM-dependent methyltransferase
MDLQKFLEKLPQQYQDWGSPLMSPISEELTLLSEKIASYQDRNLFPLLNLAVACLASDEVYCQVGCFRRGSLIGAFWNNSDRSGYGVEAFFKYDSAGEKLNILSEDLADFQVSEQIFLSDQETENFFDDLQELNSEEKLGIYYYDGAEDYRSLFMSLLLAKQFLSDSALIIINKCQHPALQQALKDFIKTHPQAQMLLDYQVANHGLLGLRNICLLAWNAAADITPLKSPKKLVLNVGCGPYNPEALPQLFRDGNWQEIRLDINTAVNPDILGTITDLSAVPDNSVDGVFSSHNLEHIYHYEVPIALEEFKRILKPDGFLMIVVPDMQTAAEFVARGDMENEPLYISPGGPVRALWMFYGMGTEVPGMPYMAHKTGFTSQNLTQKLQEANFPRVEVSRAEFELVAFGYKSEIGE